MEYKTPEPVPESDGYIPYEERNEVTFKLSKEMCENLKVGDKVEMTVVAEVRGVEIREREHYTAPAKGKKSQEERYTAEFKVKKVSIPSLSKNKFTDLVEDAE